MNVRLRSNLWQLALLLPAMLFASTSVARAEALTAQDIGYRLSISSSDDMLAEPGNMMVAKMAAWRSQHALLMARNEPYIQLENTSDSAEITKFVLSIGDTAANFDWVRMVQSTKADSSDPDIGVQVSLVDGLEDGLRSDLVQLEFTNFLPGAIVRFRVDLDADSPNSFPSPDFRTVLFDANGSDNSDNAEIQVTFDGLSDPRTLTRKLDDYAVPEPTLLGPGFRSYLEMDTVRIFAVSGDLTLQPVPEPGTLVLALAGVALLWSARRWRHS